MEPYHNVGLKDLLSSSSMAYSRPYKFHMTTAAGVQCHIAAVKRLHVQNHTGWLIEDKMSIGYESFQFNQ